MARRRSGEEGGGDSWLNTYADMVTLLLTFFAVLISMSTVNNEKFNAFIRSFSNLPPDVIEEIIDASGEYENGKIVIEEAIDALFQNLKTYVEENNQGDQITLSKGDGVIYIRFSSSLFFEPNRYVLRSTSYDTLSFVGDAIKEYEDSIRTINICGHTADIREGDSGIQSWMLSGERAAVVAMYFEREKGLRPDKLIAMGYGDNYPVGDNSTEEGRKLNRRVELIIVGLDSELNLDIYNSTESLYNSQLYPKSGGAMDLLLPPEAQNKDQPPEVPGEEQTSQEPKGPEDGQATGRNNDQAENTPAEIETEVSPYEE